MFSDCFFENVFQNVFEIPLNHTVSFMFPNSQFDKNRKNTDERFIIFPRKLNVNAVEKRRTCEQIDFQIKSTSLSQDTPGTIITDFSLICIVLFYVFFIVFACLYC